MNTQHATTIGQRVRLIRKHPNVNLTLENFGARIGIKKSAMSLIENEKCNVTEQIQKSICREFHVNEEWLRQGSGEMFDSKSNDELEALVQKYNLSEGARTLIEKFILMNEVEREKLLNYFIGLTSSLLNQDTENHPTNSSEKSIDEKVADYRRQLEAEKKEMEKSSVSQKNA